MSKEGLNEAISELLDSFADEGWKVNEKGKLTMESEDGRSSFNFVDYSNFCKEVNVREINLKINSDYYRVMDYPLESGSVYILVMPSANLKSDDQEGGGEGILYNSDGELNVDGNLLDLPQKIDMDKTMELFLKQVVEKRFSVPELVKMEK